MSSEFSTMDTGVFDSRGRDTVSANVFYLLLGLCLCWGLGLTAYLADLCSTVNMKEYKGYFFLAMLIPFAGCMITVCSDNPVFSFIGYNMIVAPFGFLLGPAVNQYSPNVVKDAAMVTLMVTVCMGALGVILPDLFRNMGGALFSALLCLVVVRIVQIFVPRFDFGWIDYAAALLFSLYIGFDMCRASEIPKTPDNAVDVAAQLYLDILNLFLIILKIMGKRK